MIKRMIAGILVQWVPGFILAPIVLAFFVLMPSVWADPLVGEDPQPVETMTMSPAQAAQAGGTEQAVMQAMEAVAAAMQPSVNAVAFADPAVPEAPAAPAADQAAPPPVEPVELTKLQKLMGRIILNRIEQAIKEKAEEMLARMQEQARIERERADQIPILFTEEPQSP